MCDAVQDERYLIDGVEVSNFLLPLYFTASAERGGRNDFLGRRHNGKTLLSFGVNPGGYIGFYDPAKKRSGEFFCGGRSKGRTRAEGQEEREGRATVRKVFAPDQAHLGLSHL
jgi:hypothetical protein